MSDLESIQAEVGSLASALTMLGANGSKPPRPVSDLEKTCRAAADFIDRMTEHHIKTSKATQENLVKIGEMQSQWDALMAEVQDSLRARSDALREHIQAALNEMRELTKKITNPENGEHEARDD